MQTKSLFPRITLALAMFAVASCADVPTQPAAPAVDAGQPAAILGTLLGSKQPVAVMQRQVPLAKTYTVSKYIGFFGGTLAIPEAGVSIYFPPGAMLSSTRITMSAPAGSAVAYEFGPHGKKFLVPPVITQKLHGVDMSGVDPLNIFAAYFENLSDINLATGVGLVTEVLNATVILGGMTVSFPVQHFSGYLVAGGMHSEVGATSPDLQ